MSTPAPPPPTPAQLASLPVFPLPKVVLFPGTALPLHVFEPRYVALVEHCLATGAPLAVAQIAPGHEEEHLGKPPLVPVSGVGSIIHHERQPDGRFGVVIRGTVRVRVLGEVEAPDVPFRLLHAEAIPDRLTDAKGAAALRASIDGCLSVIAAKVPHLAEALFRAVRASEDPGSAADRLIPVIFRSVPQRQALLACEDVNTRLSRVLDRLAAIAASTANSATIN